MRPYEPIGDVMSIDSQHLVRIVRHDQDFLHGRSRYVSRWAYVWGMGYVVYMTAGIPVETYTLTSLKWTVVTPNPTILSERASRFGYQREHSLWSSYVVWG
jgi:hypothetical protein